MRFEGRDERWSRAGLWGYRLLLVLAVWDRVPLPALVLLLASVSFWLWRDEGSAVANV